MGGKRRNKCSLHKGVVNGKERNQNTEKGSVHNEE